MGLGCVHDRLALIAGCNHNSALSLHSAVRVSLPAREQRARRKLADPRPPARTLRAFILSMYSMGPVTDLVALDLDGSQLLAVVN